MLLDQLPGRSDSSLVAIGTFIVILALYHIASYEINAGGR